MLSVSSECRALLSSTRHTSLLVKQFSTLSDTEVVRRKMVEKIERVDHAGEMGASFIYQGDSMFLFILKPSRIKT